MSMLNFDQELVMTDLSPISAGSPATGKSDASGVINEFILEAKKADGSALTPTEMEAAIGYIEVTVGGDTKRRLTLSDLLMLEGYFGKTNVNGQICIPTWRQDLESDGDKWLAMWGTSAKPAIHIRAEVESVAALAQISRRDRVTPFATDKLGKTVPRGIEVHNKIITKELPVPDSGIFTINDLMSHVQPADTVERIFIVDPDGDAEFGETKFMAGGNPLIYPASPERLDKIAYDAGRVPQEDVLAIELNAKNSILRASLMKGIPNLSLTHEFKTVNTSKSVRVIFETMHGITDRNPEDKVIA